MLPTNAPDDVAQAFNACTPKQRALALALAKGMGREEAMLEAGYSKVQAHKTPKDVLDHPRVVKIATWLGAQAVQKQVLTVERVVEEMGDIALFDPATIFNDEDKLLPIRQWPEAARRAFAGWDNNGMPKFWDKSGAVDRITKIKGWEAKDKNAPVVVGVVIVPQKAESGSQQVLEAVPVQMTPVAALDTPRTFQVKA